MKPAIALTLALSMAFTAAAGSMAEETVAPATPPLKTTEQRYNPGICRAPIVQYYNEVKMAASAFDPEKILKPEAKRNSPELYENVMRDGDVIHMAAYGIDRFADFEATMINLQNSVTPGTPEDRAAGERFFCESLLGYSSAIAAAVSFQIPVKEPSFKEPGSAVPDESAPTRLSFERFNARACPAPILEKFHEVTGKQIPNPHPMVDEQEMTPEIAAAYNGAQIRTGMIRAAQAGLVYAATEYANYLGSERNLDEKQTHGAFCAVVKEFTKSLEYFQEKHLHYSDPKKVIPPAPGTPKKEM